MKKLLLLFLLASSVTHAAVYSVYANENGTIRTLPNGVSVIASGGTTPGSNTQLIYNNSGTLAGSSGLTWTGSQLLSNVQSGNFAMGLFSLQNTSSGTSAGTTMSLSNASSGLIFAYTGASFSGSYLTGGVSGLSGAIYTPINVPISIGVSGTQVAVFTSTGLNNAAIGATTPAAGTFTTLIANTAAPGTNTTQVATTAFVQSAIVASTTGVSSVNTRTGAVTLTKSDVGLSNVDNTSDATKNSAAVTLSNKTIPSPLGIVKADVGLGNVDNTSDATKNSAAVTISNKTINSSTINSPSGLVKGDVGLSNVDNTSDSAKNSSTVTLTNKRIRIRTNTVTSSATPSINTDSTDEFTITALSTDITSFTSGLSGTPDNGDMLLIRILDNGSARTISWGASFSQRGAALPSTTVASKYLYVLFIWNSTASSWDCVSSAQET